MLVGFRSMSSPLACTSREGKGREKLHIEEIQVEFFHALFLYVEVFPNIQKDLSLPSPPLPPLPFPRGQIPNKSLPCDSAECINWLSTVPPHKEPKGLSTQPVHMVWFSPIPQDLLAFNTDKSGCSQKADFILSLSVYMWRFERGFYCSDFVMLTWAKFGNSGIDNTYLRTSQNGKYVQSKWETAVGSWKKKKLAFWWILWGLFSPPMNFFLFVSRAHIFYISWASLKLFQYYNY